MSSSILPSATVVRISYFAGMATLLQDLPQELVGHIFALLPDKDARQSFYAASPIVSRAPSVVDQIKAITVAGSMLLPSGENPLDTIPEGASLRQLTIDFDFPINSSSLASSVRDALQGRPGLLAGLEKVTIYGLEAKDLQLLETIALHCRNLRSITIVTGGNGGVLGPSALPVNLSDSFACLRGLQEVHLTMGCSEQGGFWPCVASSYLARAVAKCTTIRSLMLFDYRSHFGTGRTSWIPWLVFALPNLEHLVLGGSDSRCDMEDFTSANVSHVTGLPCESSVRSLCIGEIDIHELAAFLHNMREGAHDYFPSLRSLEIRSLHDRDYMDDFQAMTEELDGLNPWHGRTGNLNISISEVLDVTERWLLFLIDKGWKLDDVTTLRLACSYDLHSDEDMSQTMDTEFDKQRARLLVEKLPCLEDIIFVHPETKDHHAFLAGCMMLTQDLRTLSSIEIELKCHNESELRLFGMMACALCIGATYVERTYWATLDVNLLITGTSTFSPNPFFKELERGVDMCLGAHMQTTQTACTVRFKVW